MRITICGSRGIKDYNLVKSIIEQSKFSITEINCGMASGVDMLAYRWALENKIPIHQYPPNWNIDGRKAGALRNCKMVDESEGVIAIWDGISKGTPITINHAKKKNKFIFLFKLK